MWYHIWQCSKAAPSFLLAVCSSVTPCDAEGTNPGLQYLGVLSPTPSWPPEEWTVNFDSGVIPILPSFICAPLSPDLPFFKHFDVAQSENDIWGGTGTMQRVIVLCSTKGGSFRGVLIISRRAAGDQVSSVTPKTDQNCKYHPQRTFLTAPNPCLALGSIIPPRCKWGVGDPS